MPFSSARKIFCIFPLIILALTFLTKSAFAADNHKYNFTNTYPGTDTTFFERVSHDSDGNIIAAGRFKGTTDFNPGSGVHNFTAVSSRYNVFITKTDANGNEIWTKGILGNADTNYIRMSLDKNKNIYLAFDLDGTLDLDPGAGTTNVTSSGGDAVVFVKYDKNGNLLWYRSIDHSGDAIDPGDIVVDQNGDNVYLVGDFGGTDVDMDPTSGTDLFTATGYEGFISKYDKNGNYKWTRPLGGAGDDYVYGAAVDKNGYIYANGSYSNGADLDGTSGTASVSSNGGLDGFLVKYSSDGNYVWGKIFGGTGDDFPQLVRLDNKGNVYSGGYIRSGSIDFDPTASVDIHTVAVPANSNVYASKFSTDGAYRWTVTYGTDDTETLSSMAVTGNGNVYLGDNFNQFMDFDPSSAEAIYDADARAGYILALDTNGKFRWVHPYYSVDAGSLVQSIDFNEKNGYIFAAGAFSKQTDFNHYLGADVRDPNIDDNYDGYLLRLKDSDAASLNSVSILNTKNTSLKKYSYKDENDRDKKQYPTLNGGYSKSEDVTVAWDKTTAAVKYYVNLKRVGKDKTFNRVDTTDSDQTHYTFLNLKDAKYEWYISSVDATNISVKSPVYKFTVDTNVPDEFTISKINGKVIGKTNSIRLAAAQTLIIEGTSSDKGVINLDIYNSDKSIKFETFSCELNETGNFLCSMPAD
ncbi:MAG: hypothetical protein E6Q58_02430, partial [Niabella sp.]